MAGGAFETLISSNEVKTIRKAHNQAHEHEWSAIRERLHDQFNIIGQTREDPAPIENFQPHHEDAEGAHYLNDLHWEVHLF